MNQIMKLISRNESDDFNLNYQVLASNNLYMNQSVLNMEKIIIGLYDEIKKQTEHQSEKILRSIETKYQNHTNQIQLIQIS